MATLNADTSRDNVGVYLLADKLSLISSFCAFAIVSGGDNYDRDRLHLAAKAIEGFSSNAIFAMDLPWGMKGTKEALIGPGATVLKGQVFNFRSSLDRDGVKDRQTE